MEILKKGKSAENFYSKLPASRKYSNTLVVADMFGELPRLRHSIRTETLFRICQAAAFLFLTCSLLYCYANLEDLRNQVQKLNEHLKIKKSHEEKDSKKFMVDTLKDDMEKSFLRHMVTPEVKDTSGNIGSSLKRKREITPWQEYTSDQPRESQNNVRNLLRSSSLDYNFSDFPLSAESSTPMNRKRRKGLRKPKKYHRYAVVAEKYYTELEPSTTSPILIRQSRTKQTATRFDEGKHKTVLNRRPFLHVYGSKEFITPEEALRRSGGLRSIKTERIRESGKWTKSAEVVSPTSKEFADAVAYNMIMVHYAADTSHYSRERDSNYCGNGRLQMKESIYKDWKAAHSTQGVDISKYFSLNHGEVTVSVTGIYLIYAQVQYSNLQEVNGYEVIRNRQTVVQCITTSVHPDKHEIKSNTCDTSTTILLYSGDRVYIQDLHHSRHVVLKPEKRHSDTMRSTAIKQEAEYLMFFLFGLWFRNDSWHYGQLKLTMYSHNLCAIMLKLISALCGSIVKGKFNF